MTTSKVKLHPAEGKLNSFFEQNITEKHISELYIYSELEFREYVRKVSDSYINDWAGFGEEDDVALLGCANQFKKIPDFVKNIMRWFTYYMEGRSFSDRRSMESVDPLEKSSETIIKQFRRFKGERVVNNNFIHRVMKSIRYKEHLRFFLRFRSCDFLAQSPVNSKLVHLVFIFYMSRMFSQNNNFLERLYFYKRVQSLYLPLNVSKDRVRK